MKQIWHFHSRKLKSTIILCGLTLALSALAHAQPTRANPVGVVLQGGSLYAVLDGFREGLKELGVQEGKDVVLDIRDTKGDLKLAEEAAKSLEREKVKLIFAINTSVAAAAKRVTTEIPIVFFAGNNPVTFGLVDNVAKPGGRVTGVHFVTEDLTTKRLEIMKEILPKVTRVITFYDPGNRVAVEAAKMGREGARHLNIQFIERQVASVKELQQALSMLKAEEADAFFYISDAMVLSQAQAIIQTANANRLPTIFPEVSLVEHGGLASYGLSFNEAGREAAKYVQKILAGANPKDLSVEAVGGLHLALNLRTASEIGVTIPPHVVARADRVIK